MQECRDQSKIYNYFRIINSLMDSWEVCLTWKVCLTVKGVVRYNAQISPIPWQFVNQGSAVSKVSSKEQGGNSTKIPGSGSAVQKLMSPTYFCVGTCGVCGRAVSTSNSRSGALGFKPRPSRCFLRQGTLLHFVSLHLDVWMGTSDILLGGNPSMDYYPVQG